MSKVSIKRCKNYELEMVKLKLKESFEYLGGIDKVINKGDKVLLKVNMSGEFEPEKAVTTHPIVIQAVVQLVKENHGIPIIGDGPILKSRNLVKTIGLEETAQKEKVPVHIFKDYKIRNIKDASLIKNIKYSLDILNADKVIDIPKLKTHALTLYTGAIKNMFGGVEYEQRKKVHRYNKMEDFSKAIVDIFTLRVPDITIIDGIYGMGGIGPINGKIKNYGVLISSFNALEADVIGSYILGYNPHNIAILKEASQREIGRINIEEIEHDGNIDDFKDDNPDLVPYFSDRTRNKFLNRIMGVIKFNETKCVKCKECEKGCPNNAILIGESNQINKLNCLHCMRCYEICRYGAVKIEYIKLKK